MAYGLGRAFQDCSLKTPAGLPCPLGHLAIWPQRLGVAACPPQNPRSATLPAGHRGLAYGPGGAILFLAFQDCCLPPSKPPLGHFGIWTQRLGVAACPPQNPRSATLPAGHRGLAYGPGEAILFWHSKTGACPPQNPRWATLPAGPPCHLATEAWRCCLPPSKPSLGHLASWTQRLGVWARRGYPIFSIPRLLLAPLKTPAGPLWHLDTEAWRWVWHSYLFLAFQDCCLPPSKPPLGHLGIWTQRLGVWAC